MSKGEKRILELVNAFVSHEMRNPINAILGMNLKLQTKIKELYNFIEQNIGDQINPNLEDLKKEIDDAL